MLVKCPRCAALIEAAPGTTTKCTECGFEARVPVGVQPPADVKGPAGPAAADGNPSLAPGAAAWAPPKEPAHGEAVPTGDLAAPFGLMASLVGIGTFYLATFLFPLAFSLAGIGLGAYRLVAGGKGPQATASIVLGVAGLVLGAFVLVAA